MKKKFLKFMRKKIKKQYPSYSDDKIDTVMYGIEGMYITITKSIIIFSIAAIFGILKEMILLLITFNFIRVFAFGMHASSGGICLVFSSLIFIIGTYFCKYLIIPNYIIYILYAISFIIFALFAPADTVKRPLIKKKKRIRFKILSLLVTIIYFILSIFIKNNLIDNALIIGLLIECILISPLTYKIFNMPYANYKSYGLNT